MKISLTGSGKLAEAYRKVNPSVEIFSFRKMKDEEIKKIISSSDVIIHNAGALYSLDDGPNSMIDSNFGLTKKIVDHIRIVKPDIKFINIGSMSYLGKHGYLPLNKMTRYANSKLLSELYCVTILPNVKSIRFSTIFYKDANRDMLSFLCFSAVRDHQITLLNSGVAKRDWIPINIAAQYLDFVVHGKTKSIVNICSGIETSFRQIGEIIAKHVPSELIFKTMKVPDVLSKFKRELPEIKFSLEDEIKDYICAL